MAAMTGDGRRFSRGLLALVLLAAQMLGPAGPAWAQAGRDVYVKGLEHMDAKRWAEAVQAFDAAIATDPKENKGARLYGMRYGYFPHRDKGLALYQLGKFDEAAAALEESIRQGATPEAIKTLDLARKKQPAVATQGVFRDTFWDFYERGVKYSEAGAWKAAIQDFRAARAKRDKEDRRARTYGVDFIEYFPVRELGIALYHDGQFKAAVAELEKSLAAYPTAKAAYFYNLARAALLRQAAADPKPPRIKIDAPADGLLTSALAMEVRGSAESKNQVALVEINGEGRSSRRPPPPALHPGGHARTGRQRHPGPRQGPHRPGVAGHGEGDGRSRRSRGDHGQRHPGGRPDPSRGHRGRQHPARPATGERPRGDAGRRRREHVQRGCPGHRRGVPDRGRRRGRQRHARADPDSGRLRQTSRASDDVVPVAWRKQLPLPSFLQRAGLTLEMEKPPAEVQQDSVSVAGLVGSGAGLKELKINGQAHQIPAAAATKPFAFSYGVPLVEGSNTITVVASDQAGKTETRTFTVVRKVEEVAQVGSRLAVAVMPVNHKGQPTPHYASALEAMTDALVNQKRFKVLSRDQLEAILREQKLSATQLVDSATAIRLGKLVAAEAVIAITVNETPKSVEAYAQLISTETSTVLASKDIFDPEKAPGSARAKMIELAAKLKQDYPLVEGAVVTVANKRVVVGNRRSQERAHRHEGDRVPGRAAADRSNHQGSARPSDRVAGRGPAEGGQGEDLLFARSAIPAGSSSSWPRRSSSK
jgi:tetratricopeptide (TPR) repeat protein